ncbi:hypothetical protein M0208_01440 [Sphingomonas sp. SUN019]|uniref:hypothetical protein n=1 Tax=Sphingomonas sp. SUN019 TaxID=2937788 RepID=UPI002164A575|nr:hypothetical protein [Sphingomonas sp. SUN019]UVO49244.1 hypothetical protein M0208_01440 [Sphingomonas sp. SUN019]
MTAKVRIKAGPVEFEYEGETELAVADIKDLFSHIETLFKVPVLAEGGESHAAPQAPTPLLPAPSGDTPTVVGGPKLHVNSVAQKLKAKTGSEVAVAAAATLQIYDGKQTFSRTELLDTMKKATMHYSANMSGNLTKILGSLVGSKFNQISDGVYSLTSDDYQKLVAQLA